MIALCIAYVLIGVLVREVAFCIAENNYHQPEYTIVFGWPILVLIVGFIGLSELFRKRST